VDELLARGVQVGLRALEPDDANEAYLAWMRDPEVVRHLEARFADATPEALRDWVAEHAARDDTLLLAIVALDDGARHIGNVKVGPLDPHHGTADLGIMIGEKAWWGRGAATEAIRLATDLARDRLGARKLTASCYAVNPGSARAFVRAGWAEEGARPAQFVDADGEPTDQLLFGIVLR
jgi:RimJ/RimL family protein N-acetyltransferase